MIKHFYLATVSLFLSGILPAQNCDYNFVSRQFGVQTERDVLYGIDTLFSFICTTAPITRYMTCRS